MKKILLLIGIIFICSVGHCGETGGIETQNWFVKRGTEIVALMQAGWNFVVNSLVTQSKDVTLTGSIDPTASTSVTGVGTKFLTELKVGDSIDVNSEIRQVTSIASDTALTVMTAFKDTANDTSVIRKTAQIIGKDVNGVSNFVAGYNGRLTLTDGTYGHTIVNSNAEGLTGTDLRFGTPENGTNNFILIQNDDINTDLGYSSATSPQLYLTSGSAPAGYWMKCDYGGFIKSGINTMYFSKNTDMTSEDAFTFKAFSSSIELISNNSQQAWVKLNAGVKQTGTAAIDVLHIDIADAESFGDGTSGVGNNLIRADVAGVNKFKVSKEGTVTQLGLSTIKDGVLTLDDGTITLPTGVNGLLKVLTGVETIACTVGTDGAISNFVGSTNTASTDSDGNLCVYDGGTGAVIKNRLGSTKTVIYVYEYK
jgi:hypothetical protein